jgi:dihydroorotate dehydrogenase
LKFDNRLGISAGMDKNAEYIDCIGSLGFGFLELGTVTPRPQLGNTKPRVFRDYKNNAIINRLGFNNKGVDYAINKITKSNYKGVIGLNIGKNLNTTIESASDDYVYCLKKAHKFVDYITVNISSPNTTNLRKLQSKNYLNDFIKEILNNNNELNKENNKKLPIFVKISPDETQNSLELLLNTLVINNVSGVIISNTTINRFPELPIKISRETGGLSGKPLFEHSNRCLKNASEILNNEIPIIAVGGVYNKSTFQTKIELGASLVQVYSGLVFNGPRVISSILK